MRAHADAGRGAALLRRQLHGLGAARAARAVPARGARPLGHAAGLLTAIPLLGGSLFRPVIGAARRSDRRPPRRRSSAWCSRWCRWSSRWQFASSAGALLRARLLPRHRRRELRGGAAAREPLVSAGVSGAGDGHRRRRQLRHAARDAASRRGWPSASAGRRCSASRCCRSARRVRGLRAVRQGQPGAARRRRRARLRARVLGESDTLWLAFLYSLTFGGFVGFASFLTTFFHEQYHLSRVAAGDFTTIVVVAGSLLRPVGGWLVGSSRRLPAAGAAAGGVRRLPLRRRRGAAARASPWRCSSSAWALLGMGNGAVFQLVPQRFPERIGVVTGIVGAAGGLGGFFLPTLLGVLETPPAATPLGLLACAGRLRRRHAGRCSSSARAGRSGGRPRRWIAPACSRIAPPRRVARDESPA